MSSPESHLDPARVKRILDRLIEWSDRGDINWEIGGPPDSYAANVSQFRLRIRSLNGDGQAPFIFEINGPNTALAVPTGELTTEVDQRIIALYQRGKQAALDPQKALREVERQLGLDTAV
jgi:hypothetical protein